MKKLLVLVLLVVGGCVEATDHADENLIAHRGESPTTSEGGHAGTCGGFPLGGASGSGGSPGTWITGIAGMTGSGGAVETSAGGAGGAVVTGSGGAMSTGAGGGATGAGGAVSGSGGAIGSTGGSTGTGCFYSDECSGTGICESGQCKIWSALIAEKPASDYSINCRTVADCPNIFPTCGYVDASGFCEQQMVVKCTDVGLAGSPVFKCVDTAVPAY